MEVVDWGRSKDLRNWWKHMQWASAWPSMSPRAVGLSSLKKNRLPVADLALHVEFQCYHRGSDQQMILGSQVVVETEKR